MADDNYTIKVLKDEIYFYGTLDEDAALEIQEHILDGLDVLHIHSLGGQAQMGLLLADVVQRHDVVTVCDGYAYSAASVVFVSGVHRLMRRGSQVLLHEIGHQIEGSYSILRSQLRADAGLMDEIVRIYTKRSKMSRKKLRAAMQKETYLSPKQAIKWGFADGYYR